MESKINGQQYYFNIFFYYIDKHIFVLIIVILYILYKFSSYAFDFSQILSKFLFYFNGTHMFFLTNKMLVNM